MADNERQDAVISTRATREFRDHLRAWCRERQINPAAFVREAIRERIERQERKEQ